MPFVVQSEIEEGLELAEVPNGLEVPVYNSAEVVPVASELYPVASLDTKIDIITSSSTSHINLETESQKPSSALRDSPLIARKRRKRRLWIFIGAVLLSVICITIGVLVARAVPGKSGNDTSDRYNSRYVAIICIYANIVFEDQHLSQKSTRRPIDKLPLPPQLRTIHKVQQQSYRSLSV